MNSSVPVQKSAIVSEPLNRDTSSLFLVTCLSPAFAARCDELQEQDTNGLCSGGMQHQRHLVLGKSFGERFFPGASR